MQTRISDCGILERLVKLVVERCEIEDGKDLFLVMPIGGSGLAFGKVSENETLVPTFSWLSSVMVPPIDSTRDLQMLRPRPLPPYLRDVLASA